MRLHKAEQLWMLPDDGPAAPIFRSAALMRGWKWDLFKLELSFLGW